MPPKKKKSAKKKKTKGGKDTTKDKIVFFCQAPNTKTIISLYRPS